jgi:hypothetical protein
MPVSIEVTDRSGSREIEVDADGFWIGGQRSGCEIELDVPGTFCRLLEVARDDSGRLRVRAEPGVPFPIRCATGTIVAAVLRSRIRRTRADSSDQGWRHAFWNTLGKPLYLLIWVYGVYFAAMPLLLKWNAAAESHPVRRFFDTAFNVGVFIAVLWAAFRFTRVLEALFTHFARRANTRLGDLLVPLVGKTLRVLVPILGIILGLPLIGLSTASSSVVSKISGLLIIGCIAWVLFQAVALLEKVILSKYDIQAADNLEARKVYTQVQVISKTLYFLIGLFTVASMLMLFEEVRRFGTSILASAGVVFISKR